MTTLPATISFNDTPISIIDRNGTPWIAAADLARALGYARADKITQIYDRNKDEFSADMSETLNLGVSGNLQKMVRIFSPRGCHLIAMFARTKLAKAFRVWVLDVLDRLALPAFPSSYLTPEQKGKLKNLIAARVRVLPKEQQSGAYPRIWGALNHHFGTSEYANILAEQYAAAVIFAQTFTFPAVIEPPKEEETALRFPALEPGMYLVRVNASHEVVGARAMAEGTAFVSCAAWDTFWQAMMNLRPTQMYT